MDQTLALLAPGAWIVFLRLRSLGDTLLMTPVLRALKTWRPDLRLAVVVEPRFAAALHANPDVDEIVVTPALRRIRALRPALVIGLHGGTRAARYARCSGAPTRATFDGLRHRWAYNLFTPPRPRPLHAVEHVMSLVEALGLPPSPPGPLRIFPDAAARRRVRERVSEPFAFLNVEAREPGMCWPRERYAELAAWLRRERSLASVHAAIGAGEPIAGATLFPHTSLADLIAIEAESEIVIGSDGGPIHIAAALHKPTLVLYSSTDISVWSPWQTPATWLQSPAVSEIATDAVIAAVPGVYNPPS